MSGAHRAVKRRNRALLTVTAPVVVCVRWIRFRAGWLAGLLVDTAGELRAKVEVRFSRLREKVADRYARRFGDPWAEPPAAPLIPVLAALPTPAPVTAPDPEPAPLHLTPTEALPTLHTEQPHLPAALLSWRFTDGTVLGEVNSLDCGPLQQRAVVNSYATALNVIPIERDTNDNHTVVAAAGVYAGVMIVVSAVLLTGDAVPLRVYAETAEDESLTDTLTTQAIPDRVLAEVLGR